MKRCPECRRDYIDDSLLYCLDDGSPLLEGPASGNEHLTAILYESPPSAAGTRLFSSGAQHVDNTNAIAVLPFANVSQDHNAEYFSDGLTDELLNVLSKIPGLRVAGRTSAFSFKGKQTTVAKIGRQLNVSSVLEGSVRMAGNRVRIGVQLVNVADGYHRWSETYDRTIDDIFAIQDDIAHSVVEELRPRLTGTAADTSLNKQVAAVVADAAKGRAANPEAHRLMLLGRHLADRRTPDDMAKAVEYFEQALEIDPQNARCWLEIGFAQYLRAGNSFIDFAQGYEAARTASETALRVEPDLGGGHALLARVKMLRDRDFRGADEAIRRALELDPENLYVLEAAAVMIFRLGRVNESLEISRKALLTDPLNPRALQLVSWAAYASGRLDEAETTIQRSLEIVPQGVYKHAHLALILAAKGRVDEALVNAALETGATWGPWATALVEVVAGRVSEARHAVSDLINQRGEDAAFQIAEVYAAMGEVDTAFEYLGIAIEKDPGLSQILVSPHLRTLHSDERWQPLLSKIGIPEEYWPTI